MEDVTQIINWYVSGGVDCFCGDEPCNVLLPESKTNTLRPATSVLAQSGNAAFINAKEICAKAQTLDDLKEMMERFDGCSLKFSANSTVFGNGNPRAELMIVGEAPGADEDRAGEPFVGRSGRLLNKMLKAIGLERDDCFVSNILPWRPPGNRPPTDAEVAVCLPFIERQIEMVNPKIILMLGNSAANALLNMTESISHLRGHFIAYNIGENKSFPSLATFHPAYLLRSPGQKAKAWNDFLRLKEELEKLSGDNENFKKN